MNDVRKEGGLQTKEFLAVTGAHYVRGPYSRRAVSAASPLPAGNSLLQTVLQ